MKRSDFHVHTGTVSYCAKPEATVQAYIDLCAQEGVSTIGFSDHLWDTDISKSKFFPNNTFKKLSEIYATIPKDTKGVKIFVGCETDMNVYGEIGITPEHASELDFVLIPMSHYHNFECQFLGMNIDDEKFMRKFAIDRFIKACDANFSVPMGICHPFIPHGTDRRDELMQEISDKDYLDCFKYAAEKNIFIEIHCTVCSKKWKNYDNGFPVEYLRMATLAKEAGCKFTFGTDAHTLDGFSGGIHERMEQFAKRCGITEDLIISDFPRNNRNF